jgi:hypothetical protein
MAQFDKVEFKPPWTSSVGLSCTLAVFCAALVLGGLSWGVAVVGAWKFIAAGCAAMLAAGLTLLVLRRETIVLYAHGVERQNAFGSRALDKARIKGWRAAEGAVTLVTRGDEPALTLPPWLARTAAFSEWLSDLPNLDQAEYEAAMKAAMADRELGRDEAERTRRIRVTNWIARLVALASLALFAWVAAFPIYYLPAIVAAFLAPLVAVAAILIWPRRFCLLPDRYAPIPASLITPVLVGAALAIRAMNDTHLVALTPSLIAAACAAIPATWIITRIDGTARGPLPMAFLTPFVLAWLWGALVLANVWNDPSGVLRPVQIESLSATGQMVGVAPAGQRYTLDVPDHIRIQANRGVQICVLDREGRLGWRHLGVYTCPGLTSEVVGRSGAPGRGGNPPS